MTEWGNTSARCCVSTNQLSHPTQALAIPGSALSYQEGSAHNTHVYTLPGSSSSCYTPVWRALKDLLTFQGPK